MLLCFFTLYRNMFILWFFIEGKGVSQSGHRNTVYSKKLRLILIQFLRCFHAENVEVSSLSVNLSRENSKFKKFRAAGAIPSWIVRTVCSSNDAGKASFCWVGNKPGESVSRKSTEFLSFNKCHFDLLTHIYSFVFGSKSVGHLTSHELFTI